MIVTPDQIRAARALLNWSQDDLAHATDLSRPTIVNIEAARQTPGEKTLERIKIAFADGGIRFTQDEGVMRINNDIRVYKGSDEGFEFFSFLLKHMKDNHGYLYINNVYSHGFIRCFPDFYQGEYIQGMAELGDKIDLRRIRSEQDYPNLTHGQTRFVQDMDHSSITFYVFGDYVAIILFLDEAIIFCIKDEKAAKTYREKFLLQWETARTKPTIEGEN